MIPRLPLVVLLFTPAVLSTGCFERPSAEASAAGSAPVVPVGGSLPYDLANPESVVRLESDLVEISGLAIREDGRLLAVNDEAGTIFTIDPATGASIDRRRFRGAGDYEGIEWVDGTTWVLRSDGTLFAVPDDGADAVEFNTPLRSRCDAEGLGYDSIGRVLLIACKEHPGAGFRGARSIYSFDLRRNTLSDTPVLLVERRLVDSREQFKPAGLAVHPESRRVYVISSVRKALVVLAPSGALESVTPLDPDLFRQPEGIAFAPDGTLYISNEGAGGRATLLRFSPRR